MVKTLMADLQTRASVYGINASLLRCLGLERFAGDQKRLSQTSSLDALRNDSQIERELFC